MYLTSRLTRDGKTRFTCTVRPLGVGDLTLYTEDGKVVERQKRVTEMELLVASKGRHSCVGNLTLGGYSFFQSTAYASGKLWSLCWFSRVLLNMGACMKISHKL